MPIICLSPFFGGIRLVFVALKKSQFCSSIYLKQDIGFEFFKHISLRIRCLGPQFFKKGTQPDMSPCPKLIGFLPRFPSSLMDPWLGSIDFYGWWFRNPAWVHQYEAFVVGHHRWNPKISRVFWQHPSWVGFSRRISEDRCLDPPYTSPSHESYKGRLLNLLVLVIRYGPINGGKIHG